MAQGSCSSVAGGASRRVPEDVDWDLERLFLGGEDRCSRPAVCMDGVLARSGEGDLLLERPFRGEVALPADVEERALGVAVDNRDLGAGGEDLSRGCRDGGEAGL